MPKVVRNEYFVERCGFDHSMLILWYNKVNSLPNYLFGVTAIRIKFTRSEKIEK